MLQIWNRVDVDFMRQRLAAAVASLLVCAAAIASLAVNGLNFGIDFSGGTLVELEYPVPVELSEVRPLLADAVGGGDFTAQYFGSTRQLLVRLPPRTAAAEPQADLSRLGDRLLGALRDAGQEVEMRRIEFVGPQVGTELSRAGGYAMLFVLCGILVYVALRFQFRFALGAIVALAHDVLVVLGFFSATRMEFNLPVLAALLAVVGYSLNDTIVVFDRIRENFRRMHKAEPVTVVNISLCQTLSRTLITSLTTLLVLGSLAILGGEIILPFSVALIAGVLVGTYSSLYVASPVALALGVTRKDLLPVQQEGRAADEAP